MPNHQRIRANERQRIHARVAEIRRVPLSEVPYPRANTEFYYYLYEAQEISQYWYEELVFTEHQRWGNPHPRRRNRQSNQLPMEHPMEGILILVRHVNRNTQNRNNFITHERIIEQHGERLAETNNSLCIECLMPIVLGEELCNECLQEEKIIPEWMFD